MKFGSAFVGVLLLTSAPAKAADGLNIIDLTGQFDRFAMATADMPDGQRIRAFEQQIGPIGGGFYARDRNPDGYDFRVLVQLKTYPQRRNATLTVSRHFKELFEPARQNFEAVFGRVSSRQPVFLLDSMGELDGGTRPLNGGSTLLFGADVIAEVHTGQDMKAFLSRAFPPLSAV